MANRLLMGVDATGWRGFKISKPGRNVLTTNNPDHLLWSTAFPNNFQVIDVIRWTLPAGTAQINIPIPGGQLDQVPLILNVSGGRTSGTAAAVPPFMMAGVDDWQATYPGYHIHANASNVRVSKVLNSVFDSSGMAFAGTVWIIR